MAKPIRAKKQPVARVLTPELQKLERAQAIAILRDSSAIYSAPFERLFGRVSDFLTPENACQHPLLVRHMAKIYYQADPGGCSVEGLHTVPPFSGISINTLRDWRAADNWADARNNFWKIADEVVIKRIAETMTNKKAVMLKQALIWWESGNRALSNTQLKMGTWEAVLGSMLRLGEFITDLQASVLADERLQPPKLSVDSGVSQANVLTVSQEEAREAAVFLLKRRREKQQLEIENAAKTIDAQIKEKKS